MKILYLCSDPGVPVLGGKGASLHVRGLATALARAGHELAVVAASLTRAPWERAAPFEVPVVHVPPSETANAVAHGVAAFAEGLERSTAVGGEARRILYDDELRSAVARLCKRRPPDAIYERAAVFGTAGARTATELGVPLLVELNAPLAAEQSTYRGGGLGALAAAAERFTLSRAAAVLAVSEPLRAHAVAVGADPARVHVVPNGVDPELFKPGQRDASVRARLGLGTGPLLGFVGGLRAWHGADALPALTERLAYRHPGLQLVIAGDGPERVRLEEDAARRGLDGRLVALGALPQEEVPALLRELDVALAPYPELDHAFYFSPLKVFEYMACGAPVVAARIGQIEGVVRDGVTGLLYRAGDLDGLATACERVLDDAELRHRLGESAAREVRSRYTWDENARRVSELARSLASTRKKVA